MSTFKIVLRMHMPVILPAVAPRLDRLLAEGLARLHRDWETHYELPVEIDPVTGYRASQVIFATRTNQPLVAATLSLADRISELDWINIKDGPVRPFRPGTGERPQRLTYYEAIQAPFVIFYGEGDGERSARLLELLDGIGRETSRAMGRFDVETLEADPDNRWRFAPHSAAHADLDTLPFEPIQDRLCLTPYGPAEEVWRPELIIREGV